MTTTTAYVLTEDGSKSTIARSIPSAAWDKERKAWMLLSPTPRAAMIALRLFPELTYKYPELTELRDQLVQDIRPINYAEQMGTWIKAPRIRSQLLDEGKDLYRFQSVDLGFIAGVLREHGGAYIGWERGLGKTLGTCCLIEELDAKKVLIVAPNTAKQSVWAEELRKRFPDDVVLVLPNDKDKREYMLRDLTTGKYAPPPLERDNGRVILVVHYEALPIIAGKCKEKGKTTLGDGWKKLGEWDLVVADEAHRLKNPQAQMSKAIKKIPARMKLALSGSIIQNHAEELFSPLQWLFPKMYSSRWRDWNYRYLDYIDGGFGQLCLGVKIEKLPDLRDELGRYMVYRRKEDELDLPDKTIQTLHVNLSPGQRRAYDELVASCLTQLDDGTVLKASEGLAMLTKLRQVSTGLDLVGATVEDSAKLDLALELCLDAEDEAVVVFSWYRAAARSLADRLERAGVECFLVDGNVPQEVRADYIERFQAGERRVFIGTLATLSESVNLQRASNAIFLDRSWNPATNVQAEDRIYRIGQYKPVTITHIVAKDTVDEYNVAPALANKEALRRLILGS